MIFIEKNSFPGCPISVYFEDKKNDVG